MAGYACKDPQARNPVTLCRGSTDDGASLDTSAVGSFTFDVKTSDAVGNTASRQVTYSVVAPEPTSGSSAPPAARTPEPAPPSVDNPPPAGAAPPSSGVEPETAPPADEPPPRRRAAVRPTAPRPSAGRAPHAEAGRDDSGGARLAAYDPRSDPEKAVATMGAAFTLLQLGAGGGGSRWPRAAAGLGAAAAAAERGDAPDRPSRSRTSRTRASTTSAWAAGSRRSPPATGRGRGAGPERAPSMPSASRCRANGTTLAADRPRARGRAYLRAIFGSVSLLTLAIGLALGIAAVTDTAGEALPPIAALTIAIAVIGVLDAAAGLVAVGAFTIGVLLLGGVDSNADVRTLVGLSALWFAVPILAGAARPLRRLPAAGLAPTFDRGADFVVASLIGASVVYEIVGALPGWPASTCRIATTRPLPRSPSSSLS